MRKNFDRVTCAVLAFSSVLNFSAVSGAAAGPANDDASGFDVPAYTLYGAVYDKADGLSDYVSNSGQTVDACRAMGLTIAAVSASPESVSSARDVVVVAECRKTGSEDAYRAVALGDVDAPLAARFECHVDGAARGAKAVYDRAVSGKLDNGDVKTFCHELPHNGFYQFREANPHVDRFVPILDQQPDVRVCGYEDHTFNTYPHVPYAARGPVVK